MEKIWWERVPNAVSIINSIVELLLEEKSVLLQYKAGLPWRDYFQNLITDLVSEDNASKSFEIASRENADNPEGYLLKRYCKPERQMLFRPTDNLADFLAKSEDSVLHTRYIWVRLSTKESLDQWMKIVSDYIKLRGKDKEHASFLLEWAGDNPVAARKGIRIINFDDLISEYDRIVFATLASSSQNMIPVFKNYLTELASNIAGNDIELCSKCIQYASEFLKDPFDTINNIVTNEMTSDGSPIEFNHSQEEISRATWLSQIRTFYPLTEEYRCGFVEKHYAKIRSNLPIQSAFEEWYNEPTEVELGTLVYMADHGMMYLTNAESDQLHRFKNARNNLSHLSILSFDELYALFTS